MTDEIEQTARLYAWADRALGPVGAIGDHTWVTSYPAPYAADPPVPEYWYCWGEARAALPGTTSKRLLETPADANAAKRIGPPNVPKGTYGLRYGVDGVCHQMANRVLLASVESPKPVVKDARGYRLSVMRFGPYGRNYSEWRTMISSHVGGLP